MNLTVAVKNKYQRYLAIALMVVFVLCVAALFFPAFKPTKTAEDLYKMAEISNMEVNGYNAVFGFDILSEYNDETYQILNFSFLALIPYMFIFLSLSLCSSMLKKGNYKISFLLIAIFSLVAVIMYANLRSFISINSEFFDLLYGFEVDAEEVWDVLYEKGIGITLTMICLILGLIVSAVGYALEFFTIKQVKNTPSNIIEAKVEAIADDKEEVKEETKEE